MEPAERKKQVLIALAGAAVGLAILGNFFWSFFKDFFHAQPGGGNVSKTPLFIFGGFFLVMALGVVFSVAFGLRKAFKSSSIAAPPREPQPWLKRADWAAGKIKSSATVPVKMMAVFALAFGGFGGLMAFYILPKELHNGNHAALFVLLFPAIGLGFIIALVGRLRAQRRFGDIFFEPAQIPAPLGGTLAGQILVGARLRPEHGLHLKLSCIRRTVSGSGDDRSVQENILWQDEKVFRPGADLPELEPGRSGIPVHFKIPAGQPECFAHGNEAVVWRLEAKAKMAGPDFRAQFEVPVFQVAGATTGETAADEADPTAGLQESAEEIRRDGKSRITVTDGPGGRTFSFPAARNPGLAFMLTVVWIVWSGFLWLMIVKGAPVMFPIVFGFFDVLILWGCLVAWFKSSRVTVDSSGVALQSRWLIFSRTRRFEASDIARFDTAVGMTSGNTAYHDIKLITHEFEQNNFEASKRRYQQTGERPRLKELKIRDGRGITLGSAVASTPEAKWLVQEMSRALGRTA